ncbi:signal recognition particle protein [Actinokineospora inagensis]|uniref:signal recognition particle protein n=1 Tax=Actinokineospora inagensis TaxID=103730 RepID=UPI0004249B67|nr:signal recognition particle protein [Actinokineospora inagensis]
MFDTLSDRLTAVLQNLRGKGRLSETDIDTTAREIRIALLEADVALTVVRGFIARVKERAKGAEVSAALNPAQQVVKIVNEELVAILGGETRRLNLAKTPPTVIMLAGLQGAGKTTLAGKLARYLKGQGHTPLLVACDLQRPNAVTQLQVVGERAGVSVFAPEPGNGVGDPVSVARRGIEEAKRSQHDIVVVDTAGRLGVDEELMRQAADIKAAVSADEVLFVVDAMIGQDAVSTAEAFRDGVGFTGVVLTKLDGDARGGAALSVREVTGAPIMFASNGEKLEDFDAFHPDRMASRILGMGDVLTLIEQAEQHFDHEQAEKAAAKIGSGELTLEDFLEQMLAVRKMGPIANLLGMLPGAGQMKDALAQVDEKHIDRLQAIIRGMTPAERQDPKIINASRRLRIANGSGVQVRDVNDLVNRFFEAKKVMQQMAGRFGMGGRANQRKQKGKKGKKGKGRGPTPPRVRGGLPGGLPGGFPDLSGMPPGLNEIPPGLAGLDTLPPGFDPSKLRFPKKP